MEHRGFVVGGSERMTQPEVKPLHLPFDIDYLTDWMIERAEKELGETPERREKGLLKMRKLLKEDSCICIPMDDEYLLMYLRKAKLNPKKAVSQLQNGINLKTQNGQSLEPDFDGLKKAVRDKVLYILPYRDIDGSSIIAVDIKKWDFEAHGIDPLIRAITHIAIDHIDFTKASQICGVKFIIDLQGISLKYIKYISTNNLKLLVAGTTNVCPLRIRGIHVINDSTLFHYVWSIIKFWLTDKVKKRMHFHSVPADSLLDFFDPTIIPTEFGGTMTFDNTNNILKILDEREERYDAMWKVTYKSKKSRDDSKTVLNSH